MNIRRMRFFPLLALLATLNGCLGAIYRQPVVTLESVQLGGLGLTGGTLLVNLGVMNPNSFALNANQLQYSLQLGDADVAEDTVWLDFADGVYERGFTVNARDSATVQIPVEFSYAGLGGAASSILRSGTFNYQARGAVDVNTPLGTRQVPFRKKGVFTLLGNR